MLTNKQLQFCKNIVAGMSNKDAYINAYDTKCSDNTAYSESYKLLLKEEVQQKIKALRKPIEDVEQITVINARQQQIDFIKSRIQECIKKDDEQSLIRWNEQLNKIYALYKDTEQEQKTDNKVNKLDTNTLIKLADIG